MSGCNDDDEWWVCSSIVMREMREKKRHEERRREEDVSLLSLFSLYRCDSCLAQLLVTLVTLFSRMEWTSRVQSGSLILDSQQNQHRMNKQVSQKCHQSYTSIFVGRMNSPRTRYYLRSWLMQIRRRRLEDFSFWRLLVRGAARGAGPQMWENPFTFVVILSNNKEVFVWVCSR